MIKYSFIIPHYNCPELLNRCINSIPQRDDIEIIVVDDNSDDNKKPKVTRSDTQIVLLNKKHSNGAGKARNVGLKKAIGKWLIFADADDVFTDKLSNLLDRFMDDDETDIVYLNACQFDELGNTTPFRTDWLIKSYLNGERYSEMNLRYGLWTPWSRMVKRNLVEHYNLLFDEIPAGNDVMFCLNCSRHADTIEVEKDVIYKYYKKSEGSITDKARNQMHKQQHLDLAGRRNKLLYEAGYKYPSTLFSVIANLVANRQISIKVAFKEYIYYLNKYDIPLWKDLLFFIRRKFFSNIKN